MVVCQATSSKHPGCLLNGGCAAPNQAELDSRVGPEEVAALRARIEALRHLVDAQEEAEGAGAPKLLYAEFYTLSTEVPPSCGGGL